jgi:hypothetical protein
MAINGSNRIASPLKRTVYSYWDLSRYMNGKRDGTSQKKWFMT